MTRSSRQVAASFAVIASLMSFPSTWAADKLASADASMLKSIAEANIAEIETGKIALEKSSNGDIKKFAQMMVDDHSTGLADAKTLASAKGVDLPDSPNVKHKAVAMEFKALSGNIFDSRYVKQAGVGDHEATEKLLKKTQADAKDADLKALATKMLPVVQGHLKHARGMNTAIAGK